MNRQQLVRGVIVVLITVLLMLIAAEAFLTWVDPLGIAAYMGDLSTMVTIPNAEGYTLPSGTVQNRHWSYTIDDDGNRIMPSSDSECVIRFVGDSLTFGQGVNDEETFAYLAARAHPDVRFINMGKVAYNIGNVRRSIEDTEADGYIFYLADNDDGLMWWRPPSDHGVPRDLPPRLSALRYYVAVLQERGAPFISDRDGYWNDLDALMLRADLLVLGMDSELARVSAERYPQIEIVPLWANTHNLSWIDAHPNAAGHAFLYEHIAESIARFVAERCGEA